MYITFNVLLQSTHHGYIVLYTLGCTPGNHLLADELGQGWLFFSNVLNDLLGYPWLDAFVHEILRNNTDNV